MTKAALTSVVLNQILSGSHGMLKILSHINVQKNQHIKINGVAHCGRDLL